MFKKLIVVELGNSLTNMLVAYTGWVVGNWENSSDDNFCSYNNFIILDA